MHVVGTAGHVDHGKSSLVKALTGMDPDRFAEEQERGLTIDLGFAWCSLPSGREIGIVDVPGHERFIRNMLAGVGGIDAAVFVVAADEGWMPQSAEHLQILDFLQVRSGIVVLTKADLIDADMLAIVTDDVRERVQGTVLGGAPIVAVSSVTGAGLPDLVESLDELLRGVAEAADHARARLFVDRSFTITGAGTVVTGTLTGGTLGVGDEVEVVPAGHRARVRSLQTHRRTVERAVPGSRVAANLVGLEKQEVRRGDAVVAPGAWRPSDTFAARLGAARGLKHPLVERGAYELYVGSAEVPCRLKFLEDPPPHEGRIPALGAGGSLLVQVFCMRPLPLEPGDRFIVRDVGRWETVAGGVVLDHVPGRVRRGDAEVLDRLRARESAAREDLVAQIVSERKLLARDDLGWLAGAGPTELGEAVARAVATGRAVATAGYVLDAGHEAWMRSRALEVVGAHHAEHRLDAGLDREALRQSLGLDAKPFAELIAAWTSAGTLVADGATIRLASHGLEPTAEDRAIADRAIERLRSGGASPPEVQEVGLSAELLKALERSGELVVIAHGLAYPADVMAAIEERVVRLVGETGPVTVAQVRDAVGTTRKYAVPLLEHFDESGLTRRQGDTRVLGPRGRRLAGLE